MSLEWSCELVRRVHRVGVLQGQPEGFPSHVTSVRLPRKRSHCFLTPAQLSTGECVGALGVQASEIVLWHFYLRGDARRVSTFSPCLHDWWRKVTSRESLVSKVIWIHSFSGKWQSTRTNTITIYWTASVSISVADAMEAEATCLMTSIKDKKSIHHLIRNPQYILSEGKVVFHKINLKN